MFINVRIIGNGTRVDILHYKNTLDIEIILDWVDYLLSLGVTV